MEIVIKYNYNKSNIDNTCLFYFTIYMNIKKYGNNIKIYLGTLSKNN